MRNLYLTTNTHKQTKQPTYLPTQTNQQMYLPTYYLQMYLQINLRTHRSWELSLVRVLYSRTLDKLYMFAIGLMLAFKMIDCRARDDLRASLRGTVHDK